jgi:hypothetical protein
MNGTPEIQEGYSEVFDRGFLNRKKAQVKNTVLK